MTSPIGFQLSRHISADEEMDLDGMKRIETSEPLSSFRPRNAQPFRRWRDGLGLWVGFVLSGTEGSVIVASPSAEDDGFGTSIWLPPRMSYRAAARIAQSHMQEGRQPRFVTDEGRRVRLPS